MAENVAPDNPTNELVIYITDWNDLDTVKRLHTSGAANYITTLNYAFGDVRPHKLTEEESLALDPDTYDPPVHGEIRCVPSQPDDDFYRAFTAEDSVNGEADAEDAKLKGYINQVRLLKELHSQLKVVISLGGWLLSKWFAVAAATPEGRKAVIDSAIELWINGKYEDLDFAGVFDGIDIDWEFPAGADFDDNGKEIPGTQRGHEHNISRADDAENYVLLAKEFREALDAVSGDRHLLLTAATPGTWRGDHGFNYAELTKYMDWLCIMSYDMHGTWNPYTAHGAPLKDFAGPQPVGVEEFFPYLIESGAGADKIVLGIPFYGPHWKNVSPDADGKVINVPGEGVEPVTYRDLLKLAAEKGLDPQWDDQGQGSYFYDAEAKKFYSYDSVRVIEAKAADVVKKLGLRGMMAWEFDGDTAEAELTLAMARAAGIPEVS